MLIYTSVPSKKRKKKAKPNPNATPKRVKKAFVEMAPRESTRYQAPDTKQYPSLIDRYLAEQAPEAPKKQMIYEGEMADREAAAQKEIARKKTMVAPMYNKGGYQYVGDVPADIVKTLGRKI